MSHMVIKKQISNRLQEDEGGSRAGQSWWMRRSGPCSTGND